MSIAVYLIFLDQDYSSQEQIVTANVEVCYSLPACMGDLLLVLWIFHCDTVLRE